MTYVRLRKLVVPSYLSTTVYTPKYSSTEVGARWMAEISREDGFCPSPLHSTRKRREKRRTSQIMCPVRCRSSIQLKKPTTFFMVERQGAICMSSDIGEGIKASKRSKVPFKLLHQWPPTVPTTEGALLGGLAGLNWWGTGLPQVTPFSGGGKKARRVGRVVVWRGDRKKAWGRNPTEGSQPSQLEEGGWWQFPPLLFSCGRRCGPPYVYVM